LTSFATLADGTLIHHPRCSRKAERPLAKCQRRVSKRKKGSHRRRKAVCWLAKAHQRVRRQRQDFHHNTALALVQPYDTLSVEAIQPATLSRRPAPLPDGNGGYLTNGASRTVGLNKSIQDAGWRQFLHTRTFKAAGAGKRVAAVTPAYTSQDCSGCGERSETSLSVRTHVRTNCALILDRDENAASTIVWRGQRLRGLAGMPAGMNREPAGL
jgi:putative transposase